MRGRPRHARPGPRRVSTIPAGAPGFTLIELLVVIAIIAILASITFVAIRLVMARGRAAQAGAEIQQLVGALDAYQFELGACPPDTGDWNESVTDARSIHRYLGRALVNPATGREVGPFLSIEIDRYRPLDADGVGVLADPWGNPYHLDAMHMKESAGHWKRTGEPYMPSRPEAEKTREYKVVSFGPDGESAPYPFDQDAPDARSEDDIRSW